VFNSKKIISYLRNKDSLKVMSKPSEKKLNLTNENLPAEKTSQFVIDKTHSDKRKFYPKLNTYRGIGATIIIFYHSLVMSRNWQNITLNNFGIFLRSLGLVSVVFFLILSGYLNFRPYAVSLLTGEPPVVKGWGFLIRRLSKLLPIYWLALLIFWLIIPGLHNSLHNIWSYIFLYNIYTIHKNIMFLTGIITSWTLAIEYFYLIPLVLISLLLGFKRVKLKRLGLALFILFNFSAIILSNLLRYHELLKDPNTFREWLPLEQWDKFCYGELIALLFVYLSLKYKGYLLKRAKAEPFKVTFLKKTIQKILFSLNYLIERPILFRLSTYPISIILIILFPVADWFIDHKSAQYFQLQNFTVLPLALTIMLDGLLYNQGTWFKNKFLAYLGKISYPLFIFHPVAIDIINLYYLKNLPLHQFARHWFYNFIITMFLSILFGFITDKIIVKPVTYLTKKFGSTVSI